MSNVNPNEIKHFNAQASHWWDLDGPLHTLHAINPLRINFIREQVDVTGKTIIDVGCGGGILTEGLAHYGAKMTGIDLAEDALAAAKQHCDQASLSIDYQCISAEAMANQHPNAFDCVTCFEMLEHVPDPKSIVQSCASLCKPDGWVFFSTINRNLKAFLQTIVAGEYLLKLLPQGTHHYENFIKPAELSQMARKAALTTVKSAGIDFELLSHRFRLSESTDVNYLLACQKA